MRRNSRCSVVVHTVDTPKSEYNFRAINLNLVTLTLSACRYFEKHTKAEVTIKFGTDGEIKALNTTYRNKENTTNILSFPSNDDSMTFWDTYLGDQILSLDVIAKEANDQGKPFINHYSHMIIHSTLHLLGFDHQTDKEAEEMELLETKILTLLNIPSPY